MCSVYIKAGIELDTLYANLSESFSNVDSADYSFETGARRLKLYHKHVETLWKHIKKHLF